VTATVQEDDGVNVTKFHSSSSLSSSRLTAAAADEDDNDQNDDAVKCSLALSTAANKHTALSHTFTGVSTLTDKMTFL